MKLSGLGELGVIKRISKRIKTDGSVVKGIGDDAAVIRWGRGKLLLFASDMVIEGVHFDARRVSPYRIGWKALCVNISDIAAMGGEPRYAVVSLGLPKGLDLRFLDGIYAGLNAAARRFGVNIAGGDTNSSDKIIIDVAIIGRADKDRVVSRSGARPKDIIAVTGTLGGSIKKKHLNFTPRVKEALFLTKNYSIHSMIDISDGLASDLTRICEESRAGARIYESLIPLSKDAESVKNALYDGEDFELLFTAPQKGFGVFMKKFEKRFKTPLTAVGEITHRDKGIIIVDRFGKTSSLKDAGYKHF